MTHEIVEQIIETARPSIPVTFRSVPIEGANSGQSYVGAALIGDTFERTYFATVCLYEDGTFRAVSPSDLSAELHETAQLTQAALRAAHFKVCKTVATERELLEPEDK